MSDWASPAEFTVESLRAAIDKCAEMAWEPHRHLFNGRAEVYDGFYACAGCGAVYEWRGGEPVL